MKVLLIGAGGAGEAIVNIVVRQKSHTDWLKQMTVFPAEPSNYSAKNGTVYQFPAGMMEMDSEYKRGLDKKAFESGLN